MQKKEFILNKQGLKLAAVVHKPDSNGIFPAVILLHGFTGYKEEEHIETLASGLASEGIVAIRFDASGFGDSQGTIEKDFRFSNYLSDIGAVYDYLISQEFVDKNRIGIWGHSMGAMLAIIFAAQNKQIKAVCSVSAPPLMGDSDKIALAMANWKEKGWYTRTFSKTDKDVKIPYAFILDAQKFNVLDYVASVQTPLLVVIGKVDDAVRPESTRQIFDAANEPKKLLEYDGMGHDYKKYPELLSKVNAGALTFFKENL